MRLTELNQRTLITEGWNDPRLTLLETKTIIPFVSSIEKYIVEAQLTPDQISQLFTNVEQGATAAGGNRTMIGKGKDAASFISKKIDELGAQLKQAGPVQNADAKFKELKAKIGATDSKVAKAIQGVSDWAVANPGKASIAVAILTAAAAMAGGPLGGAIGGFLARATKDLLQGADLSTAVGKSIKTGIVGALIGFGLEKIGDVIGDALAWGNDTINPSYMTAKWDYMDTDIGSGDWMTAKLVGMPEDIEPIRDMWTQASSALESNNYAKFDAVWSKIEAAVDQLNSPEYIAALDGTDKARATWQAGMQAFSKMMDGVAAGAQGAAQASDDKKESTQFNPIQIETIIEWCDQTPAVILTEGPMDAIKKAGSAVGGALKKGAAAVGAKAAKVGKNITTKVTADKLNSAWKKAGSPTDSDEIANILRQQGVSDQVLAPIYKTMGAKLPAAPVAADPNQPAKGQPTQSAKGQPTAGASNTTQSAKGQPTAGASNTTQTAKGQSAAGASNTTQTAKGQSAAGTADFKSLQKTVANLNAQDAATLVTYIDSLSAKTTSATQGQADTTAAPTAPAQGQAAANPTPTPKASNLNSYFQNFSKEMQGAGDKKQKIALAKELVNIIADRGGEGSEAAVSILRKVGGDLDNNFKQAAMNALKNGQRLLKQSVYFEITKMLREHNLSWSDLGIRVHLLEGTNKVFGISFK